ncbi:MAG: hypothetical protein RRA45_06480 [Saccharolobus sp.]|uniref:hypothetical protein n=1 Tax=Saccharolobus sp. TaxID=2100761 RepID=UPI0028CF5ED5|nr:hypothetical protein [Saccharolobus sp.]MDT7861842.1 hypothetical protein [Saccharolobus sp.]
MRIIEVIIALILELVDFLRLLLIIVLQLEAKNRYSKPVLTFKVITFQILGKY